MILKIDTADFERAKLVLKDTSGKIVAERKFEAKKRLSQELLPQLTVLLGRNKVKLEDLTGIEVNLGPGSFTSLRIGVAVANALAYALDILVNGQTMVVPEYGKEPKITAPNQ